jgi:hypothetical protein
VAHLTLDLSQELIGELEKRVEKCGQSMPDFSREELELHYLHRLPKREKGDISDRPETPWVIQLQDDMRRRHEGFGYSGSAVVREMRERGS